MARARKNTGRIKSYLLAAILAVCVWVAPWRLMSLGADVLVLRPGPVELRTDQDDQYWDCKRLEARLDWLHYDVTYQRDLNYMGSKVFGLTDTNAHHIYIEEDLHWNDRFAVLAHEAGHTLQPGYLDRQEGDVFAESVSYLVAGDRRNSARWLSSAKPQFIFVALAEWRAIYHAAAVLQD